MNGLEQLETKRPASHIEARKVGAIACAACPLASLCAEKDTGDCPPDKEVMIRSNNAAALLERDDIGLVTAGLDGTFTGIINTGNEAQLAKLRAEEERKRRQAEEARRAQERIRVREAEAEKKAPQPRGETLGEFVASLLIGVAGAIAKPQGIKQSGVESAG